MTFSEALKALKSGKRVTRCDWGDENIFLYLVQGSRFEVSRPPLLGIYPEGSQVKYRSHIDINTAKGASVPWVATQSDLLEDDWLEVVFDHTKGEILAMQQAAGNSGCELGAE